MHFSDCSLSFHLLWHRIFFLSAGCGCYTESIRGTKNFDTIIGLSGNRRKFTSMFRCASLAHPCASVAGWQTKFQVSLTDLFHASAFRRTERISCQTLERLAKLQKKNALVRTAAFRYPEKRMLSLAEKLLYPVHIFCSRRYGKKT